MQPSYIKAGQKTPLVEYRHPRRKRSSLPSMVNPRTRNDAPRTASAAANPDRSPSREMIMEIVNSVKCCDNPEVMMLEQLEIVQRQQRQRFAGLPEHARSDPWIQERNEEILRNNLAIHDAALDILRKVLNPGFAG